MAEREYTPEQDLDLMRKMRRCGHLLYHHHNLNGSQMRILLALRGAPMTQKALTEKMRIQPGSLSEILTKVERAGLVEKRRSAIDRRNYELNLTEEGFRQANEFERTQLDQAQHLLEPLNTEQKDQLGELLSLLIPAWEKSETQNTEK